MRQKKKVTARNVDVGPDGMCHSKKNRASRIWSMLFTYEKLPEGDFIVTGSGTGMHM